MSLPAIFPQRSPAVLSLSRSKSDDDHLRLIELDPSLLTDSKNIHLAVVPPPPSSDHFHQEHDNSDPPCVVLVSSEFSHRLVAVESSNAVILVDSSGSCHAPASVRDPGVAVGPGSHLECAPFSMEDNRRAIDRLRRAVGGGRNFSVRKRCGRCGAGGKRPPKRARQDMIEDNRSSSGKLDVGVSLSSLVKLLQRSSVEILRMLSAMDVIILNDGENDDDNYDGKIIVTMEEEEYIAVTEEILFLITEREWVDEKNPKLIYAVEKEVVARIMEMMKKDVDSECAPNEGINKCDVIAVVRHCLGRLKKKDLEKNEECSFVLLDPDKIAAFLAHRILSSLPNFDTKWTMRPFISEWLRRMPGTSPHAPDPMILRGIAIITNDANGENILTYLPARELLMRSSVRYPPGKGGREEYFRQIFASKMRWTLKEILPYVLPLVEEEQAAAGENFHILQFNDKKLHMIAEQILKRFVQKVADNDGKTYYLHKLKI